MLGLRRSNTTLRMSQLGQKAKYSLGVDVFRFAPESGLKSDIAPCPKSAAMTGHQKTIFFARSPCVPWPVLRNPGTVYAQTYSLVFGDMLAQAAR